MKHVILLTLFAFYFLYDLSGQGTLADLEKSFQNNSKRDLDKFIEYWVDSSLKIKSSAILDSEIKKEASLIFVDFYKPYRLRKIDATRFIANFYRSANYYIVQNNIIIRHFYSDSLDYSWATEIDSSYYLKHKIESFNPDLKFRRAKIIIYTPMIDSIFNHFLGREHSSFGLGNLGSPSVAIGESKKRMDFLNKRLAISHGHWGGYWMLLTSPIVFSIDFNNNKTIAKVQYQIFYEGGEAEYKKINGKWVLQDAKIIWSE